MTITLSENFRAVFYAPFYVAHALEAYRDEGVDVRLKTSDSPGPTAGGLSDGEAGVWWGGPMRMLVAHDQRADSGLVAFCEVVTRDPFFVVGRVPRPDFHMSDLTGLRVGTVSEVPTPWLCLQDDIRRAGMDPDNIDRIGDRTMAENEAALRAGTVEAIQVFQPYAEHLIRDGIGHIWYAAADRGPCSYTALYAKWETLRERRDIALAMTRAIYRTLKWLHGQTPAAIAETVATYFPDLDPDVLTGCIARYIALGAYGKTPVLPRVGFDRLRQACLSGGLVSRGGSFEECVDTALAKITVEADPPSM